MVVTQVADLLNNTIVPNLLGEGLTISADLKNIVDLGTALADVSAEDVQDYAKDFVVGVARNLFDARSYKSDTYGLMNDAREFGGVVQRVKVKLYSATDSPIWTLENGQDYFDGTYYGPEVDAKIYNKDTIFQVKNSIPVEMFKQSFTSVDGVMNLISTIEQQVDNTITMELNGLAKTTLQQMIVSSAQDGRVVKLLTEYNTLLGLTGDDALTADTCLYNAPFLRWCAMTIVRLRDLTQDMNKKYNDGTIETFTPAEDLRVTLLSEFARAIQYNMEADTFHNDLVSVGDFNVINFWQNSGNGLLTSLGVTAQVKTHYGVESDTPVDPVSIKGIVGVIFDRYTAGLTARLDKITAQYIANGDYTTYFHHIANSRFIDTRNTGIVLQLA